MKNYDITILTERRYINPPSLSGYVENILLEDQLIGEALSSLGYRTVRKSWDDKDFDWSDTEYVLFRTIWDYFDRFSEFQTWIKEIEGKCKTINPLSLIKWNWDKHYLIDLKNTGVNIPPTEFITRRSSGSLKSWFNKSTWDKAVLKPTVSGAARHTYVIDPKNIGEHEEVFRTLVSTEDMMLQQFQNSIIEFGEISVMMFGGEFSHAVLKKARPGDFRVQDDFGGTVHPYIPNKDEIQLAEMTIQSCGVLPAYARVDLIIDQNSQPVVSELELIEPELWLRRNHSAANKMAFAIDQFIQQ